MHIPVMPDRVIEYMRPKDGAVYLDATAGEGGHTMAILGASGPTGNVVCVDADEQALMTAKANLKAFGNRVKFIKANYKDIPDIARQAEVKGFDGIVVDLGFNTSQIDDDRRGFSFNSDGPLDMRYDMSRGITAYDVVNTFTSGRLEDIIKDYGEERRYKPIVKAIIKARARSRIQGTAALAYIISTVVRGRSRIHPATRTFQAIRIFVNNEIENLKEFLKIVEDFLNAGGVLVVISFHSLEDRIVKNSFKQLSTSAATSFKILTRKPVKADADELRINRRARSAKLRAIQRLG
jgi:16S rRNA (cytosine1402-N4)-methyltransferase